MAATLQNKIRHEISGYLQKYPGTEISFDHVRVSFLRSFPKVHLEITDIVCSDQDHEVIKVGKFTVLFNLKKIIHDSIDIEQLVIRDASLNLFTDIHGTLTQLLSSHESNSLDSGKSLSIIPKEIQVYNFNFRSENRIKKNTIRFEVAEGSFLLGINKPLTRITAKFKGKLDSLTSRRTLILSNLPVSSDLLVLVNNDQTKAQTLEQGIIMVDSLELKPTFSLSKQVDGSLIDWSVQSENDLNAFLSIFNMKAGKDLKQTNPDAKATLVFRQKGIINPLQNPYTELDFAISEARIESTKLPSPITDLFISGNYNNGEKHSSHSASIRIDTLHAQIGSSFVEGKAVVNNLKDPQIAAKLAAKFDLQDIIKPTDLFSASGIIRVNLNINSGLNSFEKGGIMGKDLASGDIRMSNLDIYLRDSSYSIQIDTGLLSLKNQLLTINRFYGTLNREPFYIDGQLSDFDNLVNQQKIHGTVNAGFDRIDLDGFKTIARPDTTSGKFMKFLLSHLTLTLNTHIRKFTGKFGEIDDIDLRGNWEKEEFSIQNLGLNYKELEAQCTGMLSIKNNRLDSILAQAVIYGRKLDLNELQGESNAFGSGSENEFYSSLPWMKLNVHIELDTLLAGKTVFYNFSGNAINLTYSAGQSQNRPDLINALKTDFNFEAQQVYYENMLADSISAAGNIAGSRTEIKRCIFSYAGGKLSLEGVLRCNADRTLSGNIISGASEVDVKQVLGSFGNFGQLFLTDNNVSGNVSWTADLCFRLDSNYRPIGDDNLWKFNFKLTESRLSDVIPIEKALSFIRQKSKEDILISNLAFSTFYVREKLYFQDVAIKNSISDMNIFGIYSPIDTVADINLQISLSDLLFKSLKKRMIETEEGPLDVGKDKNLNLKFTGTIGQHHVKPIVRREFIKQRALLESQFNEFDVELQKRMEELSGGGEGGEGGEGGKVVKVVKVVRW